MVTPNNEKEIKKLQLLELSQFNLSCEVYLKNEKKAIDKFRSTNWSLEKKNISDANGIEQHYLRFKYWYKIHRIIQVVKFSSDKEFLSELHKVIYIEDLKRYFFSLVRIKELLDTLRLEPEVKIVCDNTILHIFSLYLEFKINIELSSLAGLVEYEEKEGESVEKLNIFEFFKKLKRRKDITARKVAILEESVSNKLHILYQQLHELYDISDEDKSKIISYIANDKLEKYFAMQISTFIVFNKENFTQKAKYIVLFNFFNLIFKDLNWFTLQEFDEETLNENKKFYESYRGDYERYKSRQVKSLLK